MFGAEVVHHPLALEAEVGLEGTMAVVEARMDDLKGSSRTSTWSMSKWGVVGPTSEFLLLVSWPTEPCFSIRTVEDPSRAAN